MSNAGRPPIFNNPEEMQHLIDDYFLSCKTEYVKDDDGKIMLTSKGFPIVKHNPYTITGLAIALGFESRQSLYDYEKDGEFSYIVKRARLRCENHVESGTLSGDIPPAPGIFVLKNYGWRDNLEITGDQKKDLGVSVTVIEERRIKQEYGELLNDQNKFKDEDVLQET